MLVALDSMSGDRRLASDAMRGAGHVCPSCRQAVLLKRGRLRIPHFAHHRTVDCAYNIGETHAHLRAKLAFAAAFDRRGLVSAIEAEVLSGGGDRRADVLVEAPDGRPVAIEVQNSAIGLEVLERRTAAYIDAGISVLWVAVLKPQSLPDARKIEGTSIVRVPRYAAPAWQRWIRGYHFGGLWFYDPMRDQLWRGRLSPATLWELSVNARIGIQSRPVPYASARYRVLDLEGPFKLDEVRIARSRRPASRASSFVFPGGLMARLVVAGEATDAPVPPLPVRTVRHTSIGRSKRSGSTVLERYSDEGWRPARTVAFDWAEQ